MVPEADARGPRAWTARAARATHDADDEQLVRAVVARDEQALGTIYHRHADTCYALARRVLNDRTLAEEVVQELFVRLWNEPERFEPERGSLRSFLLAQ